MAEASPTQTSGSVGRIPRSRILGLLIGLFAGAALLGLWWWTSVYLWSDLALVSLGGLSLVAIGAAIPFRTRDYGPKWYTVRELDAGQLDHHDEQVAQPQMYEFAWLPADQAAIKWRELALTDDDF